MTFTGTSMLVNARCHWARIPWILMVSLQTVYMVYMVYMNAITSQDFHVQAQ